MKYIIKVLVSIFLFNFSTSAEELYRSKEAFKNHLDKVDIFAFVLKLDGPVTYDEFRDSMNVANIKYSEYDLYEEWKNLFNHETRDKFLVVWELAEYPIHNRKIYADYYGDIKTGLKRGEYALIFFNQENSNIYYRRCWLKVLDTIDIQNFTKLRDPSLIKNVLIEYMVDNNSSKCIVQE